MISEQIEGLPEVLTKAIQQNHSHQTLRTSLPTLVENMDEKNGQKSGENGAANLANYSYVTNGASEQSQKPVYLHPERCPGGSALLVGVQPYLTGHWWPTIPYSHSSADQFCGHLNNLVSDQDLNQSKKEL